MAQPVIGLRSRRLLALSLAFALLGSLIPLVAASAADALSFTQGPPVTATSGTAFPITVHDDGGNGIPVTLSLINGNAGANLNCTPSKTVSTSGTSDAMFSCTVDKVGTNYRIHATAPGAANKNSAQFDVIAGAADHLVFLAYPTSPSPTTLSPQPSVAVVDAAGNTIISDNTTVITLQSTPTDSFACTGGLSKMVFNGVATFSGCTLSAGTGYTIKATSVPVYTQITGPAFNVVGSATQLQFCWGTAAICNTTAPVTVGAGAPFTLQPEVRVEDASGNTVTSDNTTVVTLAIKSGTPVSGGPGTLTCTGGNSKTVTAGVADFTGCSINTPGTNYQLTATSTPVLTPATSGAFNVAVGAASKLAFVTQPPTTATANVPFGNVQVAIEDAGGNVITSGITATIALTIGANPGAGTLTCSGGNNATTVNGVATFTGCSISAQGNGYTLVATAVATAPVTTLAPATSTAINVTAPSATITLTPSSTVITWGGSVTFTTHFGTNGVGKTFTLQVSKDGVNWSNITGATIVTDGSGNGSFTYRPSDNRYYRASFAGTGDLGAGNSNVVRVVVRQISVIRPAPTSTYRTISRGTQITFTSTIRPNRPELPQATAHFKVYQFQNGEWVQVLDRMVPVDRSNGVATLQITFNTPGKFYARSQAIPTSFNANSVWSDLVRYIVR
jgi:hypothetical protein